MSAAYSTTDLPFMLPPEKKRRKKSALSEQAIQKTIFEHIAQRGVPGLFAFHPANGGYRRPVEARILKGLGVTAGVPDIILFHNFRSYALELKAEGGKLTPAQEQCLIALRDAGVAATHVHGLEQALRRLESWGLLRGRADLTEAAE